MIDDLPAEWVKAANVPNDKTQLILYFHGGGFFLAPVKITDILQLFSLRLVVFEFY
ncbi:hypothetical protein N752_11660 [Desulforamulus aquiferis]|nr:hypothetical protein N752_11660 [Desulforamulus aquiferis]